MEDELEGEEKPRKLPERFRPFKEELWAWLKKNDLREETWWDIDEDGTLRISFNNDMLEVFWPGSRESTNRLQREFFDIFKRHGCRFIPKNDTELLIFHNVEDADDLGPA